MTIGLSYLQAEGIEMGFGVDEVPRAVGTAYTRVRGGREHGPFEKPVSSRKVAQSYLIIQLQTGLRISSLPSPK